MVVRQADVQRRGGACARAPVSCVVRDLLVGGGLLRPLSVLRVLDLTYGRGAWWLSMPQARVAAFDIRRLSWVRRPACFYRQPCQSWRLRVAGIEECLGGPPDVVAVDPPWQECVKGNGCNGLHHFRAARAFGSPESILEAAWRAGVHYRAPIVVHYREPWIPDGYRLAAEAWFQPSLPRAGRYKSWFGLLVGGG